MRAGRAHAALVFDVEPCVGWCQFGSPTELPRIHGPQGLSGGRAGAGRLAFSGKGYRGQGIVAAALEGVLAEIARLGGGRVEAFPEDTKDRKASPAVLFNGALEAFKRLGFVREGRISKHKWEVARTVGWGPRRHLIAPATRRARDGVRRS